MFAQVTTAHRLSLSMLQWNRTAATKLHDASQKQVAAVRQQLALADAEQELASMEAQVRRVGTLKGITQYRPQHHRFYAPVSCSAWLPNISSVQIDYPLYRCQPLAA